MGGRVRLDGPIVRTWLTVAVVVLGIAARLPALPAADDLETGHPDARTYFWKAVAVYGAGRYEPLPHGGSGWPLLLSVMLRAFGVDVTQPESGEDLVASPEAVLFAYALHAMLAAGLVVVTLLLARLFLRPLPAIAASAFVAVDPFLLGHTTDLMADGLYAILFLGALACAVHAKDHPAWLAGAGALMALAHMARINGLVMLLSVLAFSAWEARARGARLRAPAVLALVGAFLLVCAPYLAWRAAHLPGAFDYGTNQRFFTDDPWNMSDDYWTHYSIREGGPREGPADYLATHTLGEGAERLLASIGLQIRDLLLGEGERAVLALPLLALAAVGIAPRESPTRLLIVVLAFTFATFVWIYPAVRSPRYYLALVPLAAILAARGLEAIPSKFPRFAIPFAVVTTGLLVVVGLSRTSGLADAIQLLQEFPRVRMLVLVLSTIWLALAVAPDLLREAHRSRIAVHDGQELDA